MSVVVSKTCRKKYASIIELEMFSTRRPESIKYLNILFLLYVTHFLSVARGVFRLESIVRS